MRATAAAVAVVAAGLSRPAAGDEGENCPAPATARAGERTKLGFSPDEALRALRIGPRRLTYSRETPANASLFAELGLSPATPNDEAVVEFAASGAAATYCPARPQWPLWIPGRVTVRLSRGPVLTDKTSLGVHSSGGRPPTWLVRSRCASSGR